MKTYLFILYLLFSSINSFGQLQNSEVKNRHTLGIGLLPLTSTALIHNTYHLKVNYAYFFKSDLIGYASVFYFNNGKEYHGNILGVEGDAQFSLVGNQLKLGVRKIIKFENHQSKNHHAYTFLGFSLARSTYEIKQEILIKDFLGNIGYDKKYDDFNSFSYEFQLGLIFKLNNRLNLISGCGFGIATNDNVLITSKQLPDIGFTTRGMGPFLNFSIDLFYNFNK
ncbi:MAG: hypothetical protein ACEQSR_12730 [Candidatus Methylacidiphilales bacterium]